MSISNPLHPDFGFFMALNERVKVLEEKGSKNKKTEVTRARQMLLLKHTGLLKIILDLNITKKAKAGLLSALLNRGANNIEDDLTYINDDISPISTQANYDFIIETFEKAGLENFAAEAEKILILIPEK